MGSKQEAWAPSKGDNGLQARISNYKMGNKIRSGPWIEIQTYLSNPEFDYEIGISGPSAPWEVGLPRLPLIMIRSEKKRSEEGNQRKKNTSGEGQGIKMWTFGVKEKPRQKPRWV